MSRRRTEVIARHTEDLTCQLTTEEVIERGARLAEVEHELAKHARHKQQVASQLKTEEKRLEAERHNLAQQVRSRCEMRPVEVEELADYVRGTVSTLRTDSGQVVHSRALRDSERQATLLPVEQGPAEG